MTVSNTNCTTCSAAYVSEPQTVRQYLHEVANKVTNWWSTVQRRHTERAAIKQMLELDDQALHDIGITKADVIWANSLPLGDNPTHKLQKIARKRW